MSIGNFPSTKMASTLQENCFFQNMTKDYMLFWINDTVILKIIKQLSVCIIETAVDAKAFEIQRFYRTVLNSIYKPASAPGPQILLGPPGGPRGLKPKTFSVSHTIKFLTIFNSKFHQKFNGHVHLCVYAWMHMCNVHVWNILCD